MIKSGFYPVYAQSCKHPNIINNVIPTPLPNGNLRTNKTPDWCPCIKNAVYNSEPDVLKDIISEMHKANFGTELKDALAQIILKHKPNASVKSFIIKK